MICLGLGRIPSQLLQPDWCCEAQVLRCQRMPTSSACSAGGKPPVNALPLKPHLFARWHRGGGAHACHIMSRQCSCGLLLERFFLLNCLFIEVKIVLFPHMVNIAEAWRGFRARRC